ncbi:hypothetical protein GT044_27975, partial [Streptomyces sp. SID335]|nr:hypothetical protein [Streptomyces sp. SID335]
MAPPAAKPPGNPPPAGNPTATPHTATVANVPVDTRHWIAGARVTSATHAPTATFTDHSPIDGAPLAEIARGTAAEARAAVAAADAAFP